MEEEILILDDKELKDAFVGDAFSAYIKEISVYPLLSIEENKELARLYKSGDLSARQKMINSNLRLVVSVAHKFKHRINHLHILDIIQEGNIGLMRAIDEYNPDIGAFSTYAIWWVKQAIRRAIADKESEIRIPVHMVDKTNRYLQIVNECKKANRTIPSDSIICEMLDISMDTLNNIKNSLNTNVVSMNKTIDDDEKSELGDFLFDETNDYEKLIDDIDSNSLLVVIKEVLSPLLYFVLYNRFFEVPCQTLEEIASQINITRERVRQLEKKALDKIKPYLMKDSPLYYKKRNLLINNYGLRFDKLKVLPIIPEDIIKYFYLKNILTDLEMKYYYYIYFDKFYYTQSELCTKLKLSEQDFSEFVAEFNEKVKMKFEDIDKYRRFRDIMRKNYGSKLFELDYNSDVNIIDYQDISDKYFDKSYDEIMSDFQSVKYVLTPDEQALIDSFYKKKERSNIGEEQILREVNLTMLGYKEKSVNVPKNKLYEVYLKNLEDYNEEQRLFLECYYFKVRDRSEFKTQFSDSSLYYRYYYLISRLERTYYNIYRYFDNSFTQKDWLRVKKKYRDRFTPERIEYLDLFYGVDGKKYTIPEIAALYNCELIKMHDMISDARDYAINLAAGISNKLEINKKVYIPYIKNEAYPFTLETRNVLRMFMIENYSYDQISLETGLDKYRISNIITDAVRKMDNFRFGIVDVVIISRSELNEFFDCYDGKISEEDKAVIKLKYLKYMENKDIATSLNLTLMEVNRISRRFNMLYYSFRIKNVNISVMDAKEEIELHICESVLNEKEKMFFSYYFGIKSKYNPNGEILNQSELIDKFELTKNSYYHLYTDAINKLKGKKVGIEKPSYSYIKRDEMKMLLNDFHLPISDKERDIISYLYELNGYPYATFDELVDIYGDNKGSLVRRYQRAIVSILKYKNGELEGKINYDIDIVPNLKYFSLADRDIIEDYFCVGLTVMDMAKRRGISFNQMNTWVENIKVNLYNLLNNKSAKKFDYDYYFKVRNNPDLPFYGDVKRAIEIFDLFHGNIGNKKHSIPEIIELLGLENNTTSVNNVANDLMLSICKYRDGIKKCSTFTYEEIKEYYDEHQDEMTYYHKQFYLRYFERKENSKIINGKSSDVNYTILFDLIRDRHPEYFSFDSATRDDVIRILKNHGKKINSRVRNELMAIYDIREREFMTGKEINHIYRLLNFLDKKLVKSDLYLRKRLVN